MPDSVLLVAALVITSAGMGWLALAMDVHWNQVYTGSRTQRTVVALRVLGAVSLFGSLILCLLADTATMAVLVWMMLLAVAAASVAFALSTQPRILAPLAAWASRASSGG